jgi:hypothetical protein
MQSKLVILIMIAGIFTQMFSNVTMGSDAVGSKKKLMVHYMPWYMSKPFSGSWGWHWTMDHFNPDELNTDGKRPIASHYYPLIEPYDSNDPDVLECHVLLMKFAGIDGIIIDWYGINDFFDYAIINRNTQQIVEYAKKASLKFAICYEDQSIKHIIDKGFIAREEAIKYGQSTMLWLQENCFNSPNYLTVDNRPALLVFGPQYFEKNQWDQLFSALPQRPFLYTLPYKQENVDGVFGWVPVNVNTTTPDQWREYLLNLYAGKESGKSYIGVVFPQFHDIYEEAGLHKSYGFLEANGVKTFEETLDIALKNNCEVVQIVTFNDYGEGTMIEPTVEFGYRYLEIIQKSQKQNYNELFPYNAENLRLPVELYKLKKKYKHDPSVMRDLSKCSELLFSGNLIEAKKMLKSYQ